MEGGLGCGSRDGTINRLKSAMHAPREGVTASMHRVASNLVEPAISGSPKIYKANTMPTRYSCEVNVSH
jgi:hypothetical protein